MSSHYTGVQGLASTAYCSACHTRTHQHRRRHKHTPERLQRPQGWQHQQNIPIPRYPVWGSEG